MASPVEELLITHLHSVREAIAEAVKRADALERQIGRLAGRFDGSALAQPTSRKLPDGWSAEEDQVLRDHYATLGATGCERLLPHRSNMAIRVRASRKLGLTCLPAATRVWCSQCDARVTTGQAAACKSAFCAVERH